MDERIIRKKLEAILARACTASWAIPGFEYRLADHKAPGEYDYDTEWTPADGETGFPAGKTVFVRAKAEIPAEVNGDQLYISFDFEKLEGMLSINGKTYSGIDVNHKRAKVSGSGSFDFQLEFMSVPEVFFFPDKQRERSFLREIRFLQIDPEIEGAWYDLTFAWSAGRAVHNERRRILILDAVEKAMLAIDLTLPIEGFRREITNARKILNDAISDIAPDPEGGRIFLTGHSHIDTAWLWPVRETIRKCGRTFSTACRLMEQYPEYRFTCSQPQLYEYAKRHFPEVYSEIKRLVKEGRWETTGGMWVETDCNVPSGESLVRQILYGLRFFREEFGTRPLACWLPDVFGYPGNLPQILKGCGLDYFYTNKLHWQSRNPFPYHLFQWEAIDGTRVIAHIPLLKSFYCGDTTAEDLILSWDNYKEKTTYGELLYPFGFGDGGGGPTEQNMEFVRRFANFPGVPQTRQGLEEEYFDAIKQAAPELPVWRGELYLETHRGTYTTQGRTKRANRKNEILLRNAEIMASIAKSLGADINTECLHEPWRRLLLQQFHDILPGSSIGMVYEDAAKDYEFIAETASSVLDESLSSVSEKAAACDLLIFNTLSWSRNDIAEAIISKPVKAIEMVDGSGRTTPAQIAGQEAEGSRIVFSPLDVPAMGYSGYSVRESSKEPETSLSISESRMENRFFTLELDENGEIPRLLDKRCAREIIPSGTTANQMQLFQDGPEYESAWNVHDTFEKRRYEYDTKPEAEVIESGPVRGKVRVTRNFRDSRIVQDITMYDSVPRIDFETRGEWYERQVMLKAAFPVEVLSDSATYEIQFGAIQRTTHKNTSWDQEKFEVAAHRWADLSEAGYGVSLMNDSKYGYDVKGNILRITLLRGAEWPDPDADKGPFEFTYSLLPHSGGWGEGGTVQAAAELNVPLLCIPGISSNDRGEGTRSFFGIEGPAILETIKPAEDGNGLILRLYEPHGGRGKVTVECEIDIREVVSTNMVEEDGRRIDLDDKCFAFDIKPYQVRTFRLVS